MRPTQGPMVAPEALSGPPAVSSTVFASLKGKGNEEAQEEKEKDSPERRPMGDDLAEEKKKVVVPEDPGGGTTGLFDVPISDKSKELGKYTKMLDKEYGLVVDKASNSWSLRIGSQLVRIPTLSEYLGEKNEDRKEGGKSGTDEQAR